jgi:hypothetical protein
MVDAERTAALRDGEIDALIIEHPFGVVGLATVGSAPSIAE